MIVYARGEGAVGTGEAREFVDLLSQKGVDAVFNRDFARDAGGRLGRELPFYDSVADVRERPDAVISFGGDGTFLQTVAMLENRDFPIVGINIGRLGFLANVPKTDIAAALDHIRAGDYTIESRKLLEVAGDFPVRPAFPYAFNEFSVQKEGMNMVSVELSIDGEPVATYMADGLLVSTPTGSTAYSLSVGGPIVAPGCDCFLVSPIAPHNLTMRPLVVESSRVFTLRVDARSERCIATLDNRPALVRNHASFTVRRARHAVRLIRLPHVSFYRTLRRKLFWGLDARGRKEEEGAGPSPADL